MDIWLWSTLEPFWGVSLFKRHFAIWIICDNDMCYTLGYLKNVMTWKNKRQLLFSSSKKTHPHKTIQFYVILCQYKNMHPQVLFYVALYLEMLFNHRTDFGKHCYHVVFAFLFSESMFLYSLLISHLLLKWLIIVGNDSSSYTNYNILLENTNKLNRNNNTASSLDCVIIINWKRTMHNIVLNKYLFYDMSRHDTAHLTLSYET